MRIFEFISRVLVGSLFIVSGLIKANDPLGFSYKLEEYFAPDVLNLPVFEPWALELAVFICIVEIVLGVAVLLGSKIKLVSWSLLLMIIFFTFLTFYSAYFNKVTDCGCFGDALKFTPWQSFTKDVILFVLIAVIFGRQNHIRPNDKRDDVVYFSFSLLFIILFSIGVISWNFPILFSIVTFGLVYGLKHYVKIPQMDWVLAGLVTVLSMAYSLHCIYHLPVKDFRPYAVGKNIEEGMKTCDELGKPCPEFGYLYTLKHKENGTTKEMTDKEYLSSGIWEDDNWEIVETSEPFVVQEGYEAPVHDFNFFNEDGEDLTYNILGADKLLLIVAYDLSKTDEDIQPELSELAAKAQKQGIKVIAATASGYEKTNNFRHKHQIMYPYYTADGTMLKTIVRSNPGIVLLEKGTVKGKWHHFDLPSVDQLQ